MTTTDFTDKITTIEADWLNDVDDHVYSLGHKRYLLGTEATAASHPSIPTGYLIETDYRTASKVVGSGSVVAYTGSTDSNRDSGLIANWPYTDGYFYDTDGKQFTYINYDPRLKQTVYELGSSAVAAAHPGIITGHLIKTNYRTTDRIAGSGSTVAFSGTTTGARNSGLIANWPYTDGFYYDTDGKKFENIETIANVLEYGAAGDGSTVDSVPFASAVAVKEQIYFPDTGSFYVMDDRITIARDNMMIYGDVGSHIKWTSFGTALDAGTTTSRWTNGQNLLDGLRVAADDFTLRDLICQGPDSGINNANRLVVMAGASSASRRDGLTVENCEFYDVGTSPLYIIFTNNIRVTGCNFHNIGYQGAAFLSCTHIKFLNNRIKTITPGSGGAMYGVTFTHDSTDYVNDSNVGTLQAECPFCSDVEVAHNKIEDINWEGIDFHGAYNSKVHHNTVYDTRQGIAVTSSSGDAILYAGYNNQVTDNLVDGRNADGSTSSREWLAYGIIVSGASTLAHTNVICANNIVLYKGIASNGNTAAILARLCDNLNISDNIIDKWMGVGIDFSTGTTLVVADNIIGDKGSGDADTVAYAFHNLGTNSTKVIMTGNLLDAPTLPPRIGFRATGLTNRPMLSDNNFAAASVSRYELLATNFCVGNDLLAIIKPSAADTSPDVATESNSGLPILIQFNPTGGSITVTTLDNAVTNQRYILVNVHASNTITFNRDDAVLNGGASQVLARRDQMVLRYDGALFVQESPISVNS